MAEFPTPPVNTAAIAQAVAQATNYVIPSVNEIFDAGLTLNQVNQSQWFDGFDINPGAILNASFDGLYYNLSFLWPQLETTGIITDSDYCVPQVCSLLLGNFLYLPNIPANAFFAAMFGLAFIITIPLSIRQRTWGHMVGMVFGLICEILGYIGRILLSKNDFDSNPFYIYIVCLTIGPAFLSFSIYTCLARIVVVYGKHLSRFKPKTYTYVFAVCDFISLVLQGTGGGLAATADDQTSAQHGINIMIGGLAFQVFSLSVFMLLCADYALRVHRHRHEIDPTYYELRQSGMFRGFLCALGVATVAIYARSVFRVAELQQGFHSRFANNEITFMVLEAGMITIAVIALSVFHPTLVFGDLWRDITAVVRNKDKAGKLSEKETAVASGRPTESVEVGPSKLSTTV